jgi:cytosine/adenosine deaminase-related metal-dependent hydrolase
LISALLAQGCDPSHVVVSDAGMSRDAGRDAGGPGDSGVAPDAGGSPDSGVAPDAGAAPDAGGGDVDAGFDPNAPTLTPGARNRILLIGTVVTPDLSFDGEVLVEGTLITCAAAGADCESQPGAAGATVIETHGIIAPGLIDTHNHILFDVFNEDDWAPAHLYQNHKQWVTDARYLALLDVKQCLADDAQGKPAWCANTPYGTAAGSLRCEMDKFGELKGLIAGTTSIVGLPGTSSSCFGSLARSIDTLENGLGQDLTQTSAVFPPSKATADLVCDHFDAGKTDAYLVHCGEGVDATSLAEFQTLATVTTIPGCLLAPQTTITHGTAFGQTELTTMADAGMKLTWSPASNVFLYGDTADVPLARALGVTVALAPDWSIGGSQNLLDELRFADAWDNGHWNDTLGPRDLVMMATQNASAVLALDTKLGRLQSGYLADLVVFAGSQTQPYDAILAATPKEVSLVMVGGVVLYGEPSLEGAAPALPACEHLDICGKSKFLCVATAQTTSKLNQTYADIKAALEQGLLTADAQTPDAGWSFSPLPPLVKCP